MRESKSKLDAGAALSRETLRRRKAHVDSERMSIGSTVYLLPSGRTPYEVVGFLKADQKGLILLRPANDKRGREFSTNPILYTTTKPEKPKKPHHSRHR